VKERDGRPRVDHASLAAPAEATRRHYQQRGHMGRLLSAFTANLGLIGIGLDEDTVVLVDHDSHLDVLSNSTVTIVNGQAVGVWS